MTPSDQASSAPIACAPREVATRVGCERVVDLALGASHSCALVASGHVLCWGENGYGQLGDNTGRSSSTPALVAGLADAVEIQAGDNTTCARRRTGSVVCWGMNSLGQADPNRQRIEPAFSLPTGGGCAVGEPSELDMANVRPTAHPIDGLSDVRGISMGMVHGCAVTTAGSVTCWGDNGRGQLGIAGKPQVFLLQPIGGIPRAIEVHSAGVYSCALTDAGEVWCWGGNERGQLGTATPGPEPRRVLQVSKAQGLALDPGRACAHLADDRVMCWGDGGACADESSHAPALAKDLGKARQLVRAYGACFWCALRPSGEAECAASKGGARDIDPFALPRVTKLAAGEQHACALVLDGTVQCWGHNERGQLGREPSRGEASPTLVQWR